MRGVPVAATLALCLLLLAGCTGGSPPAGDAVDVVAQPGTIAGVVVDQAIRPLANVLVEVAGSDLRAVTDDGGAFVITGVEPGVHLVRASHGLYDTQQQSVEVLAGEAGATVRFQLTRVILATPYLQVQKFDGFLVCSVGFSLYASEECGEGVGVPCEVPQAGCQRVGGQGNNFAQWDFYLDGGFAETLVVEMRWEPTSPTVSEFQLNIGNDWTCDPFCNGNALNVTGGPSPIYSTVSFDGVELTTRDGEPVDFTADTRFSTFVWPNWGSGDPQQLNVAFNQPYQVFATAFYYLPAPADWSFLNGDPSPF
jgi:hypothetical protein